VRILTYFLNSKAMPLERSASRRRVINRALDIQKLAQKSAMQRRNVN
jgi:hypothetical protein